MTRRKNAPLDDDQETRPIRGWPKYLVARGCCMRCHRDIQDENAVYDREQTLIMRAGEIVSFSAGQQPTTTD